MGKRINRKQALEAIKRREEFTSHTGNFRARWIGEQYMVYSYRVCIADFTDGVWGVDTTRWSNTTSRHQGIVRRAIAE
jgi:hypothetical protein